MQSITAFCDARMHRKFKSKMHRWMLMNINDVVNFTNELRHFYQFYYSIAFYK